MPSYATFSTARTTEPDPIALRAAVVAAVNDPVAAIAPISKAEWRGKKTDPWTPAQIAAVQTLLDTIAALTPQLAAQRLIDSIPLWEQAAFLLILDQFNLVRSKLSPVLPAITVVQFLQAIKDKAATLPSP